ncbi:hypothetical protein ABIC64_000615 [Plantibacter flavus]
MNPVPEPVEGSLRAHFDKLSDREKCARNLFGP